jgi:K+-sensing histidine kinase KdpD
MKNPQKKTMVCVTVQKTCEQLILEGAKRSGGGGLHVVHVAKNGAKLLGAGTEAEALEFLFRIAQQYGAEMNMLRASDVVETIIEFAKRNAVECIVMGRGGTDMSVTLPQSIRYALPDVQLVIV